MAIARLGSAKFVVSDEKICTFTDLNYKLGIRTADHDVYGSMPLTEWTGYDASELSMTVVLVSVPGGSSNKMYRKLKTMAEERTLSYFLLGTKRIGSGRWMITSLSNAFEEIDGDGKVTQMSIDMSLREYR